MKTAGDILIVDDESDIRLLIGATLRDEGFTTMEAASAMEARDLLAAKPPGLAILDIWMRDSDMDGLELLEWVKSVYPEVPVVMISGSSLKMPTRASGKTSSSTERIASGQVKRRSLR